MSTLSHVVFSRASDEWETPQAVFAELDAEFSFGLDAAASATNYRCVPYFSVADDALNRDWSVYPTVFLNCPYSQCRAFVAKAAAEAKRGAIVVCLVPSRTDTRWFHEHVWDDVRHCARPGVEIRFIRGRLKFGDSKNSAPFPSVIVIFRPVR